MTACIDNGYPQCWADVARPFLRRPIETYIPLLTTPDNDNWEVARDFITWTPWGPMAVYEGFDNDRESVVPNLSDTTPPVIHDFLYVHRINALGVIINRKQADMVFRWLNETSWNRTNRLVAWHRYLGVRWFGGKVWKRRNPADPIPYHAQHLYAELPYNNTALETP